MPVFLLRAGYSDSARLRFIVAVQRRLSMTTQRYRFLVFASLLAGLGACLFLPGLGGGFVLDDAPNIVENSLLHIAGLDKESLLYAAASFHDGSGMRPLSMLSFALDYWRSGLDAQAFKATNLVIHTLTIFALAVFFRRLLLLAQWTPQRATTGALVLALLWAIHPLQVSSVLYVVQRMQTLGTLFLVLSMWAYLGLRQAQIENRPGLLHGVLAALFWALAFLSKEDSILLPAYLLLLELTVLRFRAAQPMRTRTLRNTYLVMALAGIALFLFVAVPHYWQWQTYPGRDFSSLERLLTQGRVLVMYIGQILWPWPSNLPFHYDTLVVSRGWFQPWSTLPAAIIIAGLLLWAWRWRARRPLFSFGVFLFFAGHFVTSNVIGLEMAFEHRNHFPLIGAILAIGDLCVAFWQRWQLHARWGVAILAVVVTATGAATVARAYAWGEPVRFAKWGVAVAPDSPRAWLALGRTYMILGEWKADSPYLDLAIEATEQGAERVTSLSLLSNLLTYKTMKGSVTQADWDRFLQHLEQAPMIVQDMGAFWVLLKNARGAVPLDEDGLLGAIEIASHRSEFNANQYLLVASFIYEHTQRKEESLAYFRRAVELSPPDDASINLLFEQLETLGHEDWLKELSRIDRSTVAP